MPIYSFNDEITVCCLVEDNIYTGKDIQRILQEAETYSGNPSKDISIPVKINIVYKAESGKHGPRVKIIKGNKNEGEFPINRGKDLSWAELDSAPGANPSSNNKYNIIAKAAAIIARNEIIDYYNANTNENKDNFDIACDNMLLDATENEKINFNKLKSNAIETWNERNNK